MISMFDKLDRIGAMLATKHVALDWDLNMEASYFYAFSS